MVLWLPRTCHSPGLRKTDEKVYLTAWRDSDHRGSTGPAEPLLRTTTTTNMAAANFVVKLVITNGEGCALTGTADIDQ